MPRLHCFCSQRPTSGATCMNIIVLAWPLRESCKQRCMQKWAASQSPTAYAALPLTDASTATTSMHSQRATHLQELRELGVTERDVG